MKQEFYYLVSMRRVYIIDATRRKPRFLSRKSREWVNSAFTKKKVRMLTRVIRLYVTLRGIPT